MVRDTKNRDLKQEMTLKNNLFSRYMIFRYSLALLFFANIYWIMILSYRFNFIIILPIIELCLLIGAIAEQFTLYGKMKAITQRNLCTGEWADSPPKPLVLELNIICKTVNPIPKCIRFHRMSPLSFLSCSVRSLTLRLTIFPSFHTISWACSPFSPNGCFFGLPWLLFEICFVHCPDSS